MPPKGMREKLCLVLTCEHAGNRVPKELQPLFAGKREVLKTHRGYDLGVLPLGQVLAETFKTPFFASVYTRLICDLNRSSGHPDLFSEFTKGLPLKEKNRILDSYYHPHRQAVEKTILRQAQMGRRILHIGVHSFTPCLDGQHRNADIGLLYDPKRELEKSFCLGWREVLVQVDKTVRVRRNYPYQGESDSLPTYIRKILPEETYLGIELEVNQRFFLAGKSTWRRMGEILVKSLESALALRLI